jgi:hypothetical protein
MVGDEIGKAPVSRVGAHRRRRPLRQKKVLGSSRGGEGPHGAREVVWVVEERWSRADRGLHRGGVAMVTAESKAEWWRQVLA